MDISEMKKARAIRLYRRYKNVGILAAEDRNLVESLCSIGLMWTEAKAYRAAGKDNGFKELVGFTSLGRNIFWWKNLVYGEGLLNSFRRFFHEMLNAAY